MTRSRILDILKTAAVLAAATVIGFLLESLGLSQANIITVYILGVLVVAAVTASRWYSISASLASVLLFNYIFTEPMFVLKAEDAGTQLTLLITFLAAVFTSTYTVQIKEKARLSQQDAYRSGVILDTSQMLQKAAAPADILTCTAIQLNKLLKRDITCFEQDGAGLKSPLCFREYSSPATGRGPAPDTLEELTAARKCFQEGKETGAATGLFPAAAYHFLPLQSSGSVYGVMGIHVGTTPPGDFENSLAVAIIAQCSMALEKEYISRKREEEAAMARAEQLRSNLLRSISHDLRTPLTSISGNAGVLMSDGENLSAEHRSRIYRDIYDDSMWLINLVENLLSVTRLEDGTMNLNLQIELVDEVIEGALKHISRDHSDYELKFIHSEELLLAKMDSRLIIQVIINIVDNALKYTPKGSKIEIYARKENQMIAISIADNGKGIADCAKEKIFDMFYTADSKVADSRRGLGLGLFLCKSIIQAHGGTIQVADNVPHGTIFTFTLQAEEVTLNE